MSFMLVKEFYARESYPLFEGAKYVKNRNFMEKGYANSKSMILDTLTTRYESLLHRAVDRANVTAERRVI